ncbi:MAG TPA: amidohydrolase family protein [Acidimicrobiales bacterium]|nr:amidohydrolase family protein [Acidimicrobiales bacterium]
MGANGTATGARTARTTVVDADGHVVEPPAAWAGLADEHAVRIVADAHGYEHVTVGDKEILATPLGTLATPGARFSEPEDFAPLERALPGGADPRQRLVDMDAEGIDQAVLYPSIGLYFSALEDPAAAVAIARAYNDWLATYCEADRDRLFGAAMLPLQDPEASAAELRRAVGELGCRAAFVRPNPTMGRAISDRAYEPVWEAAEELGVAIGVHEGSSVILPTLASDRPFNPFILHAVSHSFEEMLAFAQLCAFGTFERHPGLKVVFLESSGGWAPFWTERLDEQAESFGGFCPHMTHLPSEYFARQCWISFEVDEQTLPALVPFVGEERIVWGSDYPHHDATFPGAVEALRATIGPCRPSVQARVLGQNAADLYGLPPRRGGPAGVADAYFSAITLHDVDRLRTLFANDAVLDVDGTEVAGSEAIARFYAEGAFLFDDLLPQPHPLQVEGSRVTVDIDLQIAGAERRLTDRFEVDGDRIARLEVRSSGAG